MTSDQAFSQYRSVDLADLLGALLVGDEIAARTCTFERGTSPK